MTVCLPSRRALDPSWLRDPLWTRARMVPSLDLRMEDALLRDPVSGQRLVTFTRASTGTYIGSDGLVKTAAADEARITHDPTTGRRLGLLVEEARANLLTWSEDTSQWLAAPNLTVTTNQTTAPDGASTADRYLETSATSTHTQDGRAFVFVTGTVYTYSAYVKSINSRNYEIGFPVKFTDRFAKFNLSTGAVHSVDGAMTAGIESLANGWYRCWATSTCVSDGGSRVGNFVNDGLFSRNYAGNTSNGIFIWGAQLEEGSFPTSYLRTEASQATRAADIATITGGLNTSRIRTLYAEFASPASGARGIVSLNDNSANNRFGLSTSGTDPLAVAVTGGVSQASIDAGTVTANQISKLAARFNADDFAASFNGGAEVIDTIGTMPTVDRIMLGRSQAHEYLNGPITRLVGWDRPVYNLQELTR